MGEGSYQNKKTPPFRTGFFPSRHHAFGSLVLGECAAGRRRFKTREARAKPLLSGMNSNPKPRDMGEAVAVLNHDGTVRRRRDDERTVSGKEVEHEFFVVACNVGVRCATITAHVTASPPLTVRLLRVGPQVSVRQNAVLNSLRKTSFKHSVGTYWVTSRQAPSELWSEPLPSSHAAVHAFEVRSRDGHPHDFLLDFGDVFDNWINLWENKAHDADSRGDRAVAGTAHPKSTSEVMIEAWEWVRNSKAFKNFLQAGEEDDQVSLQVV